MKKFEWPFKLLRKSTLQSLLDAAAETGADSFYKKYKERFDFDNNSLENLYNKEKESETAFNTFFSRHKIEKSTIQKEIVNSFYDPPEVDISDAELFMIQDACRVKYQLDPLIYGIVENYTDYVVGTGIKVQSPVKEIQKAIDNFRKVNQLALRERENVRNTFIDGESFIIGFVSPKGETFIRKAHPRTIKEIEPCPVDAETIFSYTQEFQLLGRDGNPTGETKTRHIKDISYDDVINLGLWTPKSQFEDKFLDTSTNSTIFMKHLKFNDFDALRGMPPLRKILKFSRMYENFTTDRMILNHERSKVVWVKTILGRATEVLKRERSSPKGGSMLVENEGVKYRTEKPNLDSSDAKEDGLNLLYYIGSCIRFPIHILNQRTDQNVYASIKKADTPFAKMILAAQFFYASNWEPIYRRMLKELVDKKVLKPQYSFPNYNEDAIVMAVQHFIENEGSTPTEVLFAESKKIADAGLETITMNTVDIPISFDFEQMILQDPKEMAEVLKIHNDIGIASKHSLSTKAGYNWKLEFSRILEYQKAAMALEPKEGDGTKKPATKTDGAKKPAKDVIIKKSI